MSMKAIPVVMCILLVLGVFFLWRTRSSTSSVIPTDNAQTLQYLPLGDSYTIGQSVAEADRWPNQLQRKLAAQNIDLKIIANPARTGYTTQDLIDQELPLLDRQPDFITVQIGVNDWVQGVSMDVFGDNLRIILDRIEQQSPKSKLMLVTIPDFGKTPAGADFGGEKSIEAGIKGFNSVIIAEAAKRSIPVADVFPASQRSLQDASLVAQDGLHPSAKQYAEWVEVIFPLASSLLEKPN